MSLLLQRVISELFVVVVNADNDHFTVLQLDFAEWPTKDTEQLHLPSTTDEPRLRPNIHYHSSDTARYPGHRHDAGIRAMAGPAVAGCWAR